MRSIGKIFVGLGLVLSLSQGGLAHATGAKPVAAKPFKMVSAADHATTVARFREKMADYVEGTGTRAGHDADTPEMRIVPRAGSLIKTKLAATEVDEHDIGGPGAELNFHGPAQATRFTLLLPVSGHYGLPYKKYAGSNVYQVEATDKDGKTVYSTQVKSGAWGKSEASINRFDLVTEHEIELNFAKSPEFKVSFWPAATSKGGYTAGREVIVRHVK